jgi:hypothetical protein
MVCGEWREEDWQMRSVIACALLMAMGSTGALLLATLWSSRAQAWWDDSHGYRGVRAYGCGPACGGHYFSGVTVRVHEWRYRHDLRRHLHRHRASRYQGIE